MKISIFKTLVLVLSLSLLSSHSFSQLFEEQTGIVLPGVYYGSVIWGDYDKDGDIDIMISGFNTSNYLTVKVFRNNGSNIFSDQTSIFSPSVPPAYANSNATTMWADFNNDGFLDILINSPSGNGGNQLLIYKYEAGTYVLKLNFPFQTWNQNSTDCGDFDNDGDIDFLLTSHVSTKLFQNLGNFIFSEVTSVSLPGVANSSSKWGDYDNDGDADIVLAGGIQGWSSPVIFQNMGNDVFSGISVGGISGRSSEWGDFDNDGDLDLLVSGSGPAWIMTNNGDKTFTHLITIQSQSLSSGTGNWGDIDNDGDLDAVITGYNSSTGINVSDVHINNGDNTFTKATNANLYGVSKSSVALGDYDNDGDLDILMAGENGINKVCKVYKNISSQNNPVPGKPEGLISETSGDDIILHWNPVTTDNTPPGSMSYNIMAGAATGGIEVVNPSSLSSGLRQIFSTGNSQLGTSFKLRNIKKGSYVWKVQAIDNSYKGGEFSAESGFTYSSSVQAFGLSFNNTGGSETTIKWSRGNGDRCIVFIKKGIDGVATPDDNSTYNASEIFGSGTQIGSTGWYCVYKGTGNSVNVTGFSSLTDYIVQVQELEGGDGSEIYNNSVSEQNSNDFRTGIFTELINVHLEAVNYPSMNTTPSTDRCWLDVDNDNDLDLFIIGNMGYHLYENEGNDVFTDLGLTMNDGEQTACADINNDGYIDIAITSSSDTRIFINNKNKTFSELAGTSILGSEYGSVDWGDYDNDGDLDLILTGKTGSSGIVTKIYGDNGDNTYTDIANHNLPAVRFGSTDWGDYDNDGDLDLAISGETPEGSNITRIYKNDLKGIFTKQFDLRSATGTVDWGDYDNDGDLDLLSISGWGNKIFRNQGGNSFSIQNQIYIGTSVSGYGSWGDYDNDGDLDILLSGYQSSYTPSTKVYKNNGYNTFSADTRCVLTPAGFSSTAWGDYDSDGDLDILLMGLSADSAFAKIYRNDITVTNPIPAAPMLENSKIDKSDVQLTWRSVRNDNTSYLGLTYNLMVGTTEDGFDIVNPQSSLSGYRRIAEPGNGNLDTTFFLKNLSFDDYFWKVQAVDNGFAGGLFSETGTFSIVPVQASNLSARITSNNSILLKWERGNGVRCIVFCKETTTGISVPEDFKSYLDDIEYGYGQEIGTTGWFCVYNGRSDSAIITGLAYMKDYRFHVIEYNGDIGSEHYFTEIADGNPGVFSTGLFSHQTEITLNNPRFNDFAWGDYDNNGLSDILIPGIPSKIFTNNGNNIFTELPSTSLPNVSFGSAAWGDYNNDGNLDIIITGGTGSYPELIPAISKIYMNNGSGAFSEQTQIIIPGVFYSSTEWGDYDNDGDLDFIIAGATGSDPNFNPISKIYMNNGNGSFTPQDQIGLTGVYRGVTRWVDYDNDGDLDLHLSGTLNYQYSNCITKIYRNEGNGTFAEQTQIILPGLWDASADWGDYDNDGDLDVVMTKPGQLYVYRNDGDSFSQFFNMGSGYSTGGSACWGDYNNDGFIDILFTNFGLAAEIYKNNFGKSFTALNDGSFKFTSGEDLKWCDYDNDSDIDILVYMSGYNLDTWNLKLCKNNLYMKSGQFKPNNMAAAPTGLDFKQTPEGTFLKWNPVKSDETKYTTLSYNIKIGTLPDNEDICPSHSDESGFRNIIRTGNAQLDTTYLSRNLASGKYYWRVQGVDQGFKGGEWSAIDSFEVRNVQAFFSSDEVCFGLPTHFTDQSVATDGITSWKWDFNDGTTSSLQNPVHTFTSWSSNYVKLVITSTTGTKDSLEQNVSVKPKPLTDFSATTACQGSETTLTNLTNTSGLNVTSWSWDYGDGKGSIEKDPGTHGYLNADNYQLTLTAVADNSCSSSITKTVSVGAYPVASISATGLLNFCDGDSIILNVPYNKNYIYNWKIDDLSQIDSDSSRFAAKLSGEYTITVINPMGNCESISTPVNVKAKPVPYKPAISSLNYQDGQCPPLANKIKLTLSPEISGYNYQWFRNGAPYSNGTLPGLEDYLPQGNYSVESILDGCKAVSDNFILSYAVAPEKPTILVKGPVVWYMATNKNSYKHYKWYLNDQLIAGATKYIYVANKRLGTYRVEVADDICYTKSDPVTIPQAKSGMSEFSIPPEFLTGELADAFKNLKIYPNPTSRLFTIEMENEVFGELNISIITLSGKEILNIKLEKNSEHFLTHIDMNGQPDGTYVINMQIEKYFTTMKLIVEK